MLGLALPALNTVGLFDRMRAAQPATAAGEAACAAVRPLPAGTRVLVQRLVAKPEHNGKRARVVSFDARSWRYCVALDEGKELCRTRPNVWRERDARQRVVPRRRYCSRECQRTGGRVVRRKICAPGPSGDTSPTKLTKLSMVTLVEMMASFISLPAAYFPFYMLQTDAAGRSACSKVSTGLVVPSDTGAQD